MRKSPDLRDLVGEDLPPEELERLRHADALLRRVPAPPAEIPSSLTRLVTELPLRARSPWTRRRTAAALALAAALAALMFGVGRWTAGDGFDVRYTVALAPTPDAPGASGLIRVGTRDDESGNWGLELDVSGLPRLPAGDYYTLWLAKDGRYAASCGNFSVGPGETEVRMTVSYKLAEYDAWIVSRHTEEGEAPWLLRATIRT